MKTMAEIELPYLVREYDKRDNVYFYVRVKGRKIRVREAPGSVAFLQAYEQALAALKTDVAVPDTAEVKHGTLEWLGKLYFASAEFKSLDRKSQSNRIGVLEACFAEPRKPGDKTRIGACPLTHFGPAQVLVLRDRKLESPGAANNRLKYLSSMFAWALAPARKLAKSNPVRDVQRLDYATDGFHTWEPHEVETFEKRHPIGTKARLALALLMYTGARRGDVVQFGRQHVRDGWLTFTPNKTSRSKKTRKQLKLPVLLALQDIIDASPTGHLTFLTTEYGRGFTASGFGNWFRERCNEAGLNIVRPMACGKQRQRWQRNAAQRIAS